jgi:uncharacterized membrane protein YjgN (DUF898 family)
MNIALPVSTFASHIQVPKRTAITFMGTPGAFTSLLLQGSVLQIATAGFYRFWLITDIRRHLWSNTRIGDESLEYSGTARELLVGFVIALAILAPLYLAYFLLGIAAEQLQAFASLPLFIILWVFGHYASFQARCYRATRTVFRGVRFWMSGSASAYAGKALLWDLATILSLGLALPWRIAALERYKMCNTRFGDLPGNFVGSGRALFRRGIGLWGLAASVPVVGCALALAMGGGPRLENDGLSINWHTDAQWVVLSVTALVTVAVLPLALVLLRGMAIRWFLEGMRFGAISLESTLRGRTVLACYLVWIAATALYVTFFGGTAFTAFLTWIAAWQEGTENWTRLVLDGIGLAAFYLLFLLGLGVLKRVFIDRWLWIAVALTTTIVNFSAADRVRAAGEAAGSLGEGLADALDMVAT